MLNYSKRARYITLIATARLWFGRPPWSPYRVPRRFYKTYPRSRWFRRACYTCFAHFSKKRKSWNSPQQSIRSPSHAPRGHTARQWGERLPLSAATEDLRAFRPALTFPSSLFPCSSPDRRVHRTERVLFENKAKSIIAQQRWWMVPRKSCLENVSPISESRQRSYSGARFFLVWFRNRLSLGLGFSNKGLGVPQILRFYHSPPLTTCLFTLARPWEDDPAGNAQGEGVSPPPHC